MTDLSEDQAQKLIDDFFNTFKVLAQWLSDQGRLAIELGYSNSNLGRKRFYKLPAANNPDAKKILSQIKRYASNFPIQCENANILKKAMVAIYLAIRGGSFTGKKLYDARFLLVVHDEIVMTCAEKDSEIVRGIMTKCMNDAYYDMVPRKGEPGWIALGPEKHNWGVSVGKSLFWDH
jgi:DNA polymerase I-like protein with 3'-5' exonuclease and polymerase domains